MRAGIAGDDGDHAGQRFRLGRVDRHKLAMAARAAQDAADEDVRAQQVGAELGPPGDLLDTVDKRHPLADPPMGWNSRGLEHHSASLSAAASNTDSMILT